MFEFDQKTGELWLYDEISGPGLGGIDAGSVQSAIDKMKSKPLTVRINSPGGSLSEGVAIYNALSRHPKPVTTINDALAASIANYIYMAGSIRLAAPNSLAMIHRPFTIALGDSEEMRKTAELLDKAEASIQSVYVAKTGSTSDEIASMMAEETWFSAEEAISANLSTGIGHEPGEVEPVKIAASRFKKTPDRLKYDLAAGSKNQFFRKRRQLQHWVAKTRANNI